MSWLEYLVGWCYVLGLWIESKGNGPDGQPSPYYFHDQCYCLLELVRQLENLGPRLRDNLISWLFRESANLCN